MSSCFRATSPTGFLGRTQEIQGTSRLTLRRETMFHTMALDLHRLQTYNEGYIRLGGCEPRTVDVALRRGGERGAERSEQ